MRKSFLIVFFCLAFLFLHNEAYPSQKDKALIGNAGTYKAQDNITISGRVVDEDGFPLPGVAIFLKSDPKVGVTTDHEGSYTISVDRKATLVFSFIGYKKQERIAGEIDKLAITLSEDVKMLDDVVVVAFGKQKKESVVSSITTISPKELKVPSSNLTTAFAGRLSGVISYQRSGEPGLDNAEYFIRGITTFSSEGKRDPLILIDGVEMNSQDLARVNPDDISSFSVMKDASAAALYGARGANGVILVNTKEGVSEKVNVNFRAELSSSANSELLQLSDPVSFMRLHNQAVRTRYTNVELPYSNEKITKTAEGFDPMAYPSVDWYDYLIKDRTLNQRIYLNMTGGGKAVTYYLAANYQHDSGILKETGENRFSNNINLNKFQLRSNVTIKITPQTKALVRFYGTFDESTGPRQGGAEAFRMARNATPVHFLPYYPKDEANQYTEHILFGGVFDSEGNSRYTNPLAALASGYKKSSSSMMLSQFELEHTFKGKLEGLVARGMYNLKRDSYYQMQRGYKPFFYSPILGLPNNEYKLQALNPDTGTEYLELDNGGASTYTTIQNTMYFEGRLTYNKILAKKHDLNALLVGTLREYTDSGERSSDSHRSARTLERMLPSRNIGLAGRLAYGYDSRYFAEFNFGYNGSERFDSNHRWGFFPSAGLGWMVSNEAFMAGTEQIISKLKLKATYGLVGNDQIGNVRDRFFYLSNVTIPNPSYGYNFGTELGYYRDGVSVSRYADPNITWEIARKLNVGIEMTLFNDFDLIADFFTEKRSNILQTRADIPNTMGLLSTPQANVGIAKGRGVDVELKYQKYFNKDTWMIANSTFTYATSKYVEFEEPDYSDMPWRSRIGKKLNQPYGLIAERLFIDEADVNNSPKQSYGDYAAGDIKYKDINDDGVIDDNDFVFMGFPTVPEIIYGGGISFGYKNFDISFFLQGSGRSSFFINPASINPFVQNGGEVRGLLKYIEEDHWSENNRNLHAFWPRLSTTALDNNTRNSTWWLRNGSFLRLKNAEIGYTLPSELMKKTLIQNLRVYLSGSNLLYWSSFKMWDPEMAGNGLGYPVQRVFNLGININF